MTEKSRINATKGRLLAAFFIAAAMSGAAQAQTDSTPPSAAQSLSCLKRPSSAIEYPAKHQLDRGSGFMRLRLHFEKPDAAPRVEVLSNTAREDMQDRVYRYVADYRLPCLQPEDGTVSAVQEFSFSNTAMEDLPVPEAPQRRHSFCIVMPREGMHAPLTLSTQVQHVVAAAMFTGNGEQPPEVKLLHSTGDKRLEASVVERVRSYRMPCRTGQEGPQAMQQQFTFTPAGHRRYVLKHDAFTLMAFLSMTQGVQQLKAFFDFNTMNCPFKVNYTMYGPALPNEVEVEGERDPNRIPFLKWLNQRQLAFGSEKQSNELFGQTLQIQVPCGQLDLEPAATAAAR
ncbi:hypothetical protein H5407_05610 [Mitsuaria sp. WAJ17]|uniref:hypothetical protein n=1 Tax=Mitsuaria sp. WAJ17 TaxID=2761452 RepID=UPI001600A49E|nr:hypothetical protein [Mitsuaria sp. WAJ17]MBB2484699.1 hypothetical protein [Mitsuaria sp. WAJ17]